jgi:hypothetical protein
MPPVMCAVVRSVINATIRTGAWTYRPAMPCKPEGAPSRELVSHGDRRPTGWRPGDARCGDGAGSPDLRIAMARAIVGCRRKPLCHVDGLNPSTVVDSLLVMAR